MPARLGEDQADTGQYRRPKPIRPTQFKRVRMPPDDDPDFLLFWNEDGELFADEDLTDPTGLVIARIDE